MSEYVFRDAHGFGCDMSDHMDDGRTPAREYYAEHDTDHYGTLHEEIVRCADCVDCTYGWCSKLHDVVAPDRFCAWGTRRDA